jgi:hypothetical protein
MTVETDLKEIKAMLVEANRKLDLLLDEEPDIYSLKDIKTKKWILSNLILFQ